MRISEPAQAAEWRPKVAHGETVGFNFKTNKAPAGAKERIRGWFFCRPVRGWKFSLGILPTVSPWATFCRASGALAALVWFIAVGATAQTNTLSDVEIQGRQLAQQLCDARPTDNFTNTGVLQIRDSKGSRTNISVTFSVSKYPDNWTSSYVCAEVNFWQEALLVEHNKSQPNKYIHTASNGVSNAALDNDYSSPFAKSDFWLGDLGLEFFHWPQQKVLPKTTNLKRGRDYTLLESTNPNPPTNGYSRVLAWIDKESGGILEAEAYDFNGKLLKDFAPKSFKKVNGQWELQEMEIRNVQTGSRSRLEFDLKK